MSNVCRIFVLLAVVLCCCYCFEKSGQEFKLKNMKKCRDLYQISTNNSPSEYGMEWCRAKVLFGTNSRRRRDSPSKWAKVDTLNSTNNSVSDIAGMWNASKLNNGSNVIDCGNTTVPYNSSLYSRECGSDNGRGKDNDVGEESGDDADEEECRGISCTMSIQQQVGVAVGAVSSILVMAVVVWGVWRARGSRVAAHNIETGRTRETFTGRSVLADSGNTPARRRLSGIRLSTILGDEGTTSTQDSGHRGGVLKPPMRGSTGATTGAAAGATAGAASTSGDVQSVHGSNRKYLPIERPSNTPSASLADEDEVLRVVTQREVGPTSESITESGAVGKGFTESLYNLVEYRKSSIGEQSTLPEVAE